MNEEKFQEQIQTELAKIESVPVENVEVEEVVSNTEPTVEDKAREMGWDPNHKGPNFVSAKEYVERGSFFRKIDAQNKKIDDLLSKIDSQQKVVQQIEEHSIKVAEAQYKKGMADALARREEAIDNGDRDAFYKAEADLKQLETQKPPVTQPKAMTPEVTQDMLDWVKENEAWFNNNTPKNSRMVKEADGLFVLESEENPNLSHKEVLAIVKDKLSLLHPEMFENPNKSKAIAVTKASSVSSSAKSGLASRLTDTQKQLYQDAKNMGIKMSIEDYAKSLDLTGDLRKD